VADGAPMGEPGGPRVGGSGEWWMPVSGLFYVKGTWERSNTAGVLIFFENKSGLTVRCIGQRLDRRPGSQGSLPRHRLGGQLV